MLVDAVHFNYYFGVIARAAGDNVQPNLVSLLLDRVRPVNFTTASDTGVMQPMATIAPEQSRAPIHRELQE